MLCHAIYETYLISFRCMTLHLIWFFFFWFHLVCLICRCIQWTMHHTFVLLVCTFLKSTVFGCPSACVCDGTIVDCKAKSLTTVPSGIPNTTTHLWVFEIRLISWASISVIYFSTHYVLSTFLTSCNFLFVWLPWIIFLIEICVRLR